LPKVLQNTALGLVVCALLVALACTALSTSPTRAQGTDFQGRQAVLLSAIANGRNASPWSVAARGLAQAYLAPQASAAAIANLNSAAANDPTCSENCGVCPQDNPRGAGYWSLPLLLRAHYLFEPGSQYEGGRYAGRLPSATLDRIRAFLREYISLGAGYGYSTSPTCTAFRSLHLYTGPADVMILPTDNHVMIQASTALLATQWMRREDSQWEPYYTGWRDWWSRNLDELARKGFLEVASPTYVERHLAPLYNVRDFAEDEVIRLKAEMLIDAYWAEIALELLHGVRGGPKTRVSPLSEGDRGAISARNDALYPVYYLYLGDSAFATDARMPVSQFYNVIFATSTYRLPRTILELGGQPEARGSYEVRERRKGKCFVSDPNVPAEAHYRGLRYVFVTPDYVLGSHPSDTDKQYAPPGNLRTPQLQNSLVFATSPEAKIIWGDAPYIATSQLDMLQYRNVVLASTFTAHAPITWTLGPAGVLDLIQYEDGWCFVREGNAYAAMQATAYTWVLVAARSQEYANDWQAFKSALRATHVVSASGYLEYTTPQGDVLWLPTQESGGTCRYSCVCNPSQDRLPRVNGQVVDWAATPLFDSPYVQSAWDSGLIRVQFLTRTLTLDFRDPDQPVKTETGGTDPTPSATAQASSTLTPEGTATPTRTPSPTPTGTATHTPSPTLTATATHTPNATATLAATPPSPTGTATATPTPRPSGTPTPSPTASATPSTTCTPTPTEIRVPQCLLYLPAVRAGRGERLVVRTPVHQPGTPVPTGSAILIDREGVIQPWPQNPGRSAWTTRYTP